MRYELVVVGTSLGGLRVLTTLLSGLSPAFALPLAIAQHRAIDSSSLSRCLQDYSSLPVIDVEDKMMIEPGRVYLAPADYHLLVEPSTFALSTEAPARYARPSIDILFESAASAYAERTIGIILTGASADGALGLAKIKRHGGLTLVQEPTTAECPVMPEAAIAATPVDQILPPEAIALFLMTQGDQTTTSKKRGGQRGITPS